MDSEHGTCSTAVRQDRTSSAGDRRYPSGHMKKLICPPFGNKDRITSYKGDSKQCSVAHPVTVPPQRS